MVIPYIPYAKPITQTLKPNEICPKQSNISHQDDTEPPTKHTTAGQHRPSQNNTGTIYPKHEHNLRKTRTQLPITNSTGSTEPAASNNSVVHPSRLLRGPSPGIAQLARRRSSRPPHTHHQGARSARHRNPVLFRGGDLPPDLFPAGAFYPTVVFGAGGHVLRLFCQLPHGLDPRCF